MSSLGQPLENSPTRDPTDRAGDKRPHLKGAMQTISKLKEVHSGELGKPTVGSGHVSADYRLERNEVGRGQKKESKRSGFQ